MAAACVEHSNVKDQYASGEAARVWTSFIGTRRPDGYRQWLVNTVKSRNPDKVLDAACGDGIDSISLLEEGVHVTSTDLSESMVLECMKKRWDRRTEPLFEDWIVGRAGWLTLPQDFKKIPHPSEGYDVVFCLGNSFPHVLSNADGSFQDQEDALRQLWSMVKPGGILIVDHRNYDEIIRIGRVPQQNFMKNSSNVRDLKSSVTWCEGEPVCTTIDYVIVDPTEEGARAISKFQLKYYPHRLKNFNALLEKATEEGRASHVIFGDTTPLAEFKGTVAYYQHVVEKKC